MKYHTTVMQLMHWPQHGRHALPTTPRPMPMTKIALKMVQPTAPMSMVRNALLGAPHVRMKLLMPMPTIWKTQPRLMI